MEYIKTFFSTLIVLGALDAAWLLVVSKSLYQKAIGFLMPAKVSFGVVALVYIVLAFGLTYFVITPALAGGISVWNALLRGALLGFVIYAVYDLTNLATIKGWPVWISAIDVLWGTFLAALATGIVVWFLRLFA